MTQPLAPGSALLGKYLERNNIKQAQMARELGISRPFVSELVGGTRTAGATVALLIAEWTHGEVPAASWRTKLKRQRDKKAEAKLARLRATRLLEEADAATTAA